MHISAQVLINKAKHPVSIEKHADQIFQLKAAGQLLLKLQFVATDTAYTCHVLHLNPGQHIKGTSYVFGEFMFRWAYEAERAHELVVKCPVEYMHHLYELGYRVIESEDHYNPYQAYAQRTDIDFDGFKALFTQLQLGDTVVIPALEKHSFYATAVIFAQREAANQGVNVVITNAEMVAKYLVLDQSVNALIKARIQTNTPLPTLPAKSMSLSLEAIATLEQKYFPKEPEPEPEPEIITDPVDVSDEEWPEDTSTPTLEEDKKSKEVSVVEEEVTTPPPTPTSNEPAPNLIEQQRMFATLQTILERMVKIESKIDGLLFQLEGKFDKLQEEVKEVKANQKEIRQHQETEKKAKPKDTQSGLPGFYNRRR